MVQRAIVPIFLLLFLCPSALADGGVLQYTSIPSGETTSPWPIDYGGVGTDQWAEISLEDGTRYEGFLFNFLWNEKQCNGVFSDSVPPRLIVDSNGDGLYQTHEVYDGENDGSLLAPNARYLFHAVRFPVSLGGLKEFSYMFPVETNVTVSRYTSFTSVEIVRFQNRFEGTVLVGGTTYPAWMIIRSLNSYNNLSKTLVFLDTNRDGQFHPVDDIWFSSEGAASIDGSLWKVTTAFRETEAELTLVPYEGPTGMLKLEGDGIAQVGIRVPQSSMSKMSYEFSLPRRDDSSYTVPAQSLEFSKIWLTPGKESDIVFQWPIQSYNQATRFEVQDNQTVSQYAGGPLHQSIEVQANWLAGRLNLSNQGCTNRRGLQFVGLQKSELVCGGELPPPSWELRDRRGAIVKSGRFAYG